MPETVEDRNGREKPVTAGIFGRLLSVLDMVEAPEPCVRLAKFLSCTLHGLGLMKTVHLSKDSGDQVGRGRSEACAGSARSGGRPS